MSVFKCKMCGGTIEFQQDKSVGVCDSCGTKQTLPRLNDDTKSNLYDRANHFRRNNDFDKAMEIYNKILNEDITDAEAYWSLVICRYGVEYVEDPISRKRIPTVNRSQFTSIYMDEDFKSALRYADGYQLQIYEEEAKAIDDIQKGILEISSKEEPFDVFICYKENDNNGQITPDSVLANDLYHQLTQEGFKVFFSRITLEDKLGVAYEPYIFGALNSAKIMVVIGTKSEYLKSVWVKNEWSRYLALVKNSNGKKILIPAYKDMDPYDLPEEFSHLQAQDMSKLGFMQDLLRGIKKIINVTGPKITVSESNGFNNGFRGSTTSLMKRVHIFLEDGNWKDADEYCEKVLDQDPENAQAYLGKLMAEMKVRKQEGLKDCEQPFNDKNNYQKALRFSHDAMKEELIDCINYINERNENKRLIGIYNNSVSAMGSAKTESELINAANSFKSIHYFKNSEALAVECMDKAEVCRKDRIYASGISKMTGEKTASYEEAIKFFETISGWQDADEQIYTCKRKIEEIRLKEEADRLEAEHKAEEQRLVNEKVTQKRRKIFAIVAPIACAFYAFLFLWSSVINPIIIPNFRYNLAIGMINKGKVVDAFNTLIELNNYKDSLKKAEKIYSQYKVEMMKTAKVGDTVYFGAFEQDNNISNGNEYIRWLVLAKEDSKLLIITDKALDSQKYNTSSNNVTWESCSLREWMNGSFINVAFDFAEQGKIQSTNVVADINPEYGTNPGNNTIDKIFLLSINEVNKYFTSKKSRKCVPTVYANLNESYHQDLDNCSWLLRTPGTSQDATAYVYRDGTFSYSGIGVESDDAYFRPALWINLGS